MSSAGAGAMGERLRELKSARAGTLAAIGPLSQPQLDFSPRPGSWSIGEIADHLRLSEDLWRGEIAQLVALVRAGRPPRLKRTFADMNVAPLHVPDAMLGLLQVPLGFMNRFVPERLIDFVTEFPILPTRNPDAATPSRGAARATLIDSLQGAFEETRQLLEANADLHFEAMTSEHPLIGVVNVPQMLYFLTRHERRHHGQMTKVRTDPRCPPASSGGA